MVPGAELRARLAALPFLVLAIPGQCSLVAPAWDIAAVDPSAIAPKVQEPVEPAALTRRDEPVERSAITAKREQPVERVAIAPPAAPPLRTITLPEEVVIKAMDAGHPLFLRCWARALRKEPLPIASKVRLHLDLDEQGRVTAASSDSESTELSRCLAVVARQLAFPAPGQPAVVDVPLMFR